MANLPPLSLPLPPSLSNPFNHHSQSLSAGLSQAGPAVLLSSEGLKLNRPTLEAQGNPHFYALQTSLLGEASDSSQLYPFFKMDNLSLDFHSEMLIEQLSAIFAVYCSGLVGYSNLKKSLQRTT